MPPGLARLIFFPTYGWNLLLGRVLRCRHWWDEIEPHLLLGARPLRHDVGPLHERGVRAVVNMCDEFPGPTDLYKPLGIEQLWLRTIDFQPPSLEHIEEGVEFIQQAMDAGSAVYVHCKAGRARSATVVLCWLIKYRNLSAEDAQKKLLERRPHVSPDLFEREVVKQFTKRYRLKASD
jgi:atypical dual specificity phosphatase